MWCELALELVARYRLNPLRAARLLSYLHVAMDDALTAAESQGGAGDPGQRVAVHVAATGVLAHFFPQEPGGRFAALLAAAMSDVNDPSSGGRSAGEQARDRALARARRDGAERNVVASTRPAPGPGVWRAAPPLYTHRPLEPDAGSWPLWVLDDPLRFAPPAPHPAGSDAWLRELREVKAVRDALTAEQRAVAERWDLDHGTVTPAGVWNVIALEAAAARGLGTGAAARLAAVLNMAVYDAFVACWKVKYAWWTERPVTAIRERLDPAFTPHLVTPPFPGYVSGHASASGAASEVLAAAFPDERERFMADAEEAALSRLYGGIHLRSDNDRGLAMGRAIGRYVAARRLSA